MAGGSGRHSAGDHAERGMRPDRVVVPAPAFDNDLCLAQGVEDFAVEQFIAQPPDDPSKRGEIGALNLEPSRHSVPKNETTLR